MIFALTNLLQAGSQAISFSAAGLGVTSAGLGAVAYQQWDELSGYVAHSVALLLGTRDDVGGTHESRSPLHVDTEGAKDAAAEANEAALPQPIAKVTALYHATQTPVPPIPRPPSLIADNTTIESEPLDNSTVDSPAGFSPDTSAQRPFPYDFDIAAEIPEVILLITLLILLTATIFFTRRFRSRRRTGVSGISSTTHAKVTQDEETDVQEEEDVMRALKAAHVDSSKKGRKDGTMDVPEALGADVVHRATIADEGFGPGVPVSQAINARDVEAVSSQPDDVPAPRMEDVPAPQAEDVSIAPRVGEASAAPQAEDGPVAQTIGGDAPNVAVLTAPAPPVSALPPAVPLPQEAALILPLHNAPATPPIPATPPVPDLPPVPASPPAPAARRAPTPELQVPTPAPRARAAAQEREVERERVKEHVQEEQEREEEQAEEDAAPALEVDAVAPAQVEGPVPAEDPALGDLPAPAAVQARAQAEGDHDDVADNAEREGLNAEERDERGTMERNSPEPDDAREVEDHPEAPEVDAGAADDGGEGAPDDDEAAQDDGEEASDDDEGAPEVDEGAPDVGDGAHDAGDGDGAVDDGAAKQDVHVEEDRDEHDAEARGEDDAEGHDENDADAHDAVANVGDGEALPDDDAAVNDEDGEAVGDVDGVMHAEGAVAREDEPGVANNEADAGLRNDHDDHADDNAAREGGAVARQGARVDVNPAGGGAEPEAEDDAQGEAVNEAQDIANAAAAVMPFEAVPPAPMQDAAPPPVEAHAPAPVEAVNPAPVHVDNPAPDAAANLAPDAAAVPVPEQPEAAAEPAPEPAPAPPLVQPRRPLIWQPRARPVDPPVPAPTPFEQEHPAPFERSGLTKRTPTMPVYDPEQVEPNPHLEDFDDSEPEDVDDQRLTMWPVYGPAMKPVNDPLPEAAIVGMEGAEVRVGPAVVGAVVGEAAPENAGDDAKAQEDPGADVEGEDAQVDAAPLPAHVGSQDQHAPSPRPPEPAAYASTSAAAIKLDDSAFMKRDDDLPIASGSALPAVATLSTASPGPSSSSASSSNTIPAGAKVIELQGGPSKVDRKGKGRAVAPQEDEDRPSSLDDKITEPPRRMDDAPFAAIDVGRLANIPETDGSFDTETGSARQSLVSAVGGLTQTRGRARDRADPAPSDARQGRRASMQLNHNVQRASSSRRTKSADVQENKRPISARLRDGRTADSKSTQPTRVNSPNPTTGAGSAINARGSRIATRSSSLNKQRTGKVDEQR
ncbi:hypothetical protein EV121DRAFT_294867 [Schizophyllum commune]